VQQRERKAAGGTTLLVLLPHTRVSTHPPPPPPTRQVQRACPVGQEARHYRQQRVIGDHAHAQRCALL